MTPMAATKKTRLPARKRNAALLLRVELEKEDDGRWIADIPAIPGVTKYGETREKAIRNVQALALRVLATGLTPEDL